MRARHMLFVAAILGCAYAPLLAAQDPVKVDPKHYSVVSENAQKSTDGKDWSTWYDWDLRKVR